MMLACPSHIVKVRFDFMPKDKKLYGLPPTQLTFDIAWLASHAVAL
jgi:hypothetical protein